MRRGIIFVGHITGIMGNNHHFSFTTIMIINSKGNEMNTNLNGTTRIPRTVHGNIRSTGGGVVGITLGGNAVPRRSLKVCKTNGIVVEPTTRNANVGTNNPIHTILTLTNIHGILAGSLNSSGPVGVMGTALSKVTGLRGIRAMTTLHNGAISRVCG